MKISVIVPIYNAENYLRKCLDSIVNQTYKDIEIILINDCSTDNSLKICEDYLLRDKRIILLNQNQNEGQVNAYLKGLERASGEAIGFVDSDDWIDISMFEKLVKKMCEENADMVVCGCQKVYDCKLINEPKEFNSYKDRYIHKEIVEFGVNIFTNNNFIFDFAKFYRCNKIMKKNILLSNLKYVDNKIRVFEDNCLVLPCLLDSNKISCVKEYLYFYRQRSGSTMNIFNPEVIDTNRNVIETINKIYDDRNIIHNINLEILMCTLFTLDMILKSDQNRKGKINYLKELSKDIRMIKYTDITHYNFKIKLTLIMIKKGFLNTTINFYMIYNKLRKRLNRDEK